MNLQIALDTVDSQEAIKILEQISEYINIIEVGTPMIINYGMEPVRTLKEKFPNHTILADTKIMDAGEFEANIAFQAGADIVTVMGVTNDETIAGAIQAAKAMNGKVLVDMMCAPRLGSRSKKLVDLGADYICVHTAVDVQATGNPYNELVEIQEAIGSKYCAIAGGLTINTIEKVVPYQPEIVIVGGGITGVKDQKLVAEKIRNILGK